MEFYINDIKNIAAFQYPSVFYCCFQFDNRSLFLMILDQVEVYHIYLRMPCYCAQLVGRLSQEELMTQLPSFLPALFDAFGNQSADVRKVNMIYSVFLLP